MTRDEAISALKPCGSGHWHCGATCDSCWVNEHRCPAMLVSLTPPIVSALKRAQAIGAEAEKTLRELRKLGQEVGR